MTRPVTRIGDAELTHCSTPFRLGGFRTVYANGIPMSGNGHLNTPHKKPCGKFCCGHSFPLFATTRSVYAEGIRIGRVGDPTCTAVVQGSRNVFAG